MTTVQRLVRGVTLHAILYVAALAALFPFFWMISSSLRPESEVFAYPIRLIPQRWTVANYAEVLRSAPWGRYFLNSALVAICQVGASVPIDAMAAYALSRVRFRGRDALFVAVLGTMMIPQQVRVIPNFLIVYKLGWIDTYQALILPGIADAFGVFLLRQAFLSIPIELEEAALVDGCSRLYVVFKILLPLSLGPVAVLSIMKALRAWNDFLWPLVVTNTELMRTVQVGLSVLRSEESARYGLLMAGSSLAVVPITLVFLLFQRYLSGGIQLTGMK